jgi:hypothetical protein
VSALGSALTLIPIHEETEVEPSSGTGVYYVYVFTCCISGLFLMQMCLSSVGGKAHFHLRCLLPLAMCYRDGSLVSPRGSLWSRAERRKVAVLRVWLVSAAGTGGIIAF